MKNDLKIKNLMIKFEREVSTNKQVDAEISALTTEWNNYIQNLNPCAYTDSILEIILKKAKASGLKSDVLDDVAALYESDN